MTAADNGGGPPDHHGSPSGHFTVANSCGQLTYQQHTRSAHSEPTQTCIACGRHAPRSRISAITWHKSHGSIGFRNVRAKPAAASCGSCAGEMPVSAMTGIARGSC